MFWRMTGLSSASPVESILDKEDYTLDELLDEDEIIQECKALNSRLINFLREPTQVEQLLRYIIEEAPEDAEKKRAFKLPYISCEIFTCEVDVILRTLVENEELMNLLFSFLKPDRAHSTMLAGYFSKVVICLMSRKTIAFMNYIQDHREVIHQLVDLIGITSIVEVLIRLIGADDHMYSNYMDATPWLEDMNILEMIVDKLSTSDSPEVHANAAEILCAITRYAPAGLSARISSPSFVGRLFRHALDESRPKSVLVHSLTICISLLDPKRIVSAPFYPFRGQLTHGAPIAVNPATVDGMLENLGDLLKLLDNSSPECMLPTTYGCLQPPLGKHRLKIVEFISVLLTIGNDSAENELIHLGGVSRAIDLFFEYPFNNFLHHHVENIILSCLGSKQSLLTEHLLNECKLADKILEAERTFTLASNLNKTTMHAEGKKSPRIGNIGHITRVANKLIQLSSTNIIIQTHLQENNEWVDWHANVLLKRNALENIYQWVCGRPSGLNDRRDSDDEDFKTRDHDIPSADMLESDDIDMSALSLSDSQVSSLIANCHWFAVEANQFDTMNYVSSPITDETDEVVVDENDELLDTAMSSQFPESGEESEEPESVVLVNGLLEFEDSKYLSTSSEYEEPREWVEWRETLDKTDTPDPQSASSIPNGDAEGDRNYTEKADISDSSEADVNKGPELLKSSHAAVGISPETADIHSTDQSKDCLASQSEVEPADENTKVGTSEIAGSKDCLASQSEVEPADENTKVGTSEIADPVNNSVGATENMPHEKEPESNN